MHATAEATRQLVRMRGRSYVAFVFTPEIPIVGWLEEIDTTLARSPGFFVGKPVVLDLSALFEHAEGAGLRMEVSNAAQRMQQDNTVRMEQPPPQPGVTPERRERLSCPRHGRSRSSGR